MEKVWFDAEAKLQQTAIAQHQDELDDVKAATPKPELGHGPPPSNSAAGFIAPPAGESLESRRVECPSAALDTRRILAAACPEAAIPVRPAAAHPCPFIVRRLAAVRPVQRAPDARGKFR